ncbi:hypothetical protein DV737_g4147, partial [Chaetothyriales sp. CBS 132003]
MADTPTTIVNTHELAHRHHTALPPPAAVDFDHEFRDRQDELLQQLTNHYAPYEGLDLLVSTFEQTVDGSVQATFRDGRRLPDVEENAIKPKVGLTFLPGADTPQVNALEEMLMTQLTPDQKDSAWRVTTAGALLFNTTVHKDMTISFSDNTAAVVAATRKRLSDDGPLSDPNISSKALSLRRTTDRIVTIDSDQVKLVNDLHSEKWDLEAVLVEVDQTALMDLISNYQRVITRGGPDLPTTETTLTTSAGIKNIIRVSSSYFNSLPQTMLPATEKQKIQSEDTYDILAERQHLELLILKVLPLFSINSKIFLRALITAFDGHLVNPSSQRADQPIVWDIFVGRLLQLGYILPGTIDQLGCEKRSWVIKWGKEGFKDTSIFKNLQYSGQCRTINEIPPLSLNPEVSTTAELTVTLANKRNYIIASADLENVVRMNSGRYVVTEAINGGRSFDLDISDVWVNQTLFRAITEINSVLGLVKSILPSRPKNEIVRRLDTILHNRSLRGGTRRYEESALPEIKGCGRLTYSVAKLNGQWLALACKVDGRKIHVRELIALLHRDLNKIDATNKATELTIQSAFEGRRVSEHIQQSAYRLKAKLPGIWKLQQEAERRQNEMRQYDPKLPSEPVSKVLYQVGAANTQISPFSEYHAWYQAAENVLFIESQRRVVSQVIWSNDTLIVSFHSMPMRFFASPLRALEEHEKWEELKEGDNVLLCGHYLLVVEPTDQTFIPTSTAEPSGSAMLQINPIRGDPTPRQPGLGVRPNHREGAPHVHEEGRAHPRPIPRPVPLEQVVNWLKVTGVEAMPGVRRGRNRIQDAPVLRTAIR